MTASRDDVISGLESAGARVEELVFGAPEGSWARGVYENGWNAKQLLAHIASTSGVAGFLMSLASAPAGGGAGGAFDIDAFNAQQVAMREGRSVAELDGEIHGNLARDIEAVRSAPDDLLQKRFTAPWGVEGTVAGVIVESVERHFGEHLRDLERAAGV